MNSGGIVLCGGRSSRMGRAKAMLPFGPELMLQRVVRLLGEVVTTIVVVAAPDQELPELPPHVLIARDEQEGRGPLEGLCAGLSAIQSHVTTAFATSCDVPLLEPAVVRHMLEALGDCEAAVPVEGQFHHPLAAAYRVTVLPHIRELLAADRLRPFFLFERVQTHRVPVERLRAFDPDLRSLMNLNTPDDYRQALLVAGFAAEQRSHPPG